MMDSDFLNYLESIPGITKAEVTQLLIELKNEIKEDNEKLPEEIMGYIVFICENNLDEIIDLSNELNEQLKTRKLIETLDDLLIYYCEQEELCLICGEQLNHNTYYEINEYFGSRCCETQSKSCCPNGCIY